MPPGGGCRCVRGEHLARAWSVEHRLGTLSLGRHHEQRLSVRTSERTRETAAVEPNRLNMNFRRLRAVTSARVSSNRSPLLDESSFATPGQPLPRGVRLRLAVRADPLRGRCRAALGLSRKGVPFGPGADANLGAGAKCLQVGTGATGLEPATSGVTVLSGADQAGSAQCRDVTVERFATQLMSGSGRRWSV